MKGIELPVSALIIIIIALLVLAAALMLFYNVWPVGSETTTLEIATNNACQLLASMGCVPDPSSININNFDADKDTVINEVGTNVDVTACGVNPNNADDNLRMLCACYYGVNNADGCKTKVCNCP